MSTTTVSSHYRSAVARRTHRVRVALIAVLACALLGSMLANIALGQYTLNVSDVWREIFAGPGAESLTPGDPSNSVVWNIRLPRLVLGLLVGAALAVSGTILQGLLGNPLAEPGVIGVTSGAGVGAAAAIVFNLTFIGTATVPLFAFIAAVGTVILVYYLSRVQGEVQVLSLILTGIAVNAVAGAAISFLVYLAPTTSREEIIFWQMGSLNGAKWEHVATVAGPIFLCIAASVLIAGWLDVIALGERAARHAGIRIKFLRPLVIGLSTALCAAAVSFAGIIGFVGLIVPHILRQALGPSNRWLVPLSALGGAILVSVADLVTRILIAYSELPIGIFTALVGGPTFFILLRRNLRRGGH